MGVLLPLLAACGGGDAEELSAYSINLVGKTASVVATRRAGDGCSNSVSVNLSFTFSSNEASGTGWDSVNNNSDGTCSPKTEAAPTESGPYSAFRDDGYLLACGPVCSFNDLNTTFSGVDSDGRAFTFTSSHTRNTNIINSSKTFTTSKLVVDYAITLN
jgi:hypothetical protein